MFNRPLSKKLISLLLNTTLLSLFAAPIAHASDPVTGEIAVTGTVTLNGQAVISSTTIVSGNVIETSAGSKATVSLGKIGKVELSENSKLTLNFAENGMDGFLSQGEVKIYIPAAKTAEFTTKDVTAIADSSRENSFRLLVECAHTHVETYSGLVTMKRDKSDKLVQAGEEKIAGDISKSDCPPCIAPLNRKRLGLLPGLFGAGFAGIIAAIIGGGGNNNPEDPGINVSPIRP